MSEDLSTAPVPAAGHGRGRRRRGPEPGGWLRLEVTFQDLWHAEWALWQLGTNAEALAPQPGYAQPFRDRAQAIADRYRDPPSFTSPTHPREMHQ